MSLKNNRAIRKFLPEGAKELWRGKIVEVDGSTTVPDNPLFCWVRPEVGGQPLAIYNDSTPHEKGRRVSIGNDTLDKRVRVLHGKWTAGTTQTVNPNVGPHNHGPTSTNPSYISDWQILPLLVVATTGMIVHVNSGMIVYQGQPFRVAATDIDLTSSIPGSGARYSLIRVSSTGALSVQDGTPVDSFIDLTDDDIPACEVGYAAIAFVRLYYGQTALSKLTANPDVKMLIWGNGLFDISGFSGFSDAEGDPVDTDYTASADGTSVYAARRDHRHHLGDHDHVEADITDLDHDAVKIRGKSVPAPTVTEDGKAITYDHASGEFTYGGTGGGAYAETIGDGIETSFEVVHNLDTEDVIVQLWDLTGTDPVLATEDADTIEAADADTVTVTFTSPPNTDAYRVVILASGGSGGGSGDVTWAVIQASQLVNEVMNYPSLEPADNAQPEWWEKSASATLTDVDVAGEDITESYERCWKVVTSGDGEYCYQRYTYADQPRVKSGRKLSAIFAVWAVGGKSARIRLQSSVGSLGVSSDTAAAAWTILKIEGATLDGTYVDIRCEVDTGTAYFVPLGIHVGEKAIPLKPRGLKFIHVDQPTALWTDTTARNGSWQNVDATARTNNLAVIANMRINCVRTVSGASHVYTRRKSSSDSVNVSIERCVYGTTPTNAEIFSTWVQILDDSQQFERTNVGGIIDEEAYVDSYYKWE